MTPTLGTSSYSFPVREDAAADDSVGTVSATDSNDDTVTHSTAAGNGDGKFAISTVDIAVTDVFDQTPPAP